MGVVSPPPNTVVSSPRNKIETKRIKSPEAGECSAGGVGAGAARRGPRRMGAS